VSLLVIGRIVAVLAVDRRVTRDSAAAVAWNYTGSAFATALKDKSIRIYDARAAKMSARCAGPAT
jgi:hypothetical protein